MQNATCSLYTSQASPRYTTTLLAKNASVLIFTDARVSLESSEDSFYDLSCKLVGRPKGVEYGTALGLNELCSTVETMC